MLFHGSKNDANGGRESTVSRHIDGAPETPRDAPVTPPWRPHLLTSTPDVAGEDGPERLTRHERMSEEGHQRGRR
jgi:hypothetical protein